VAESDGSYRVLCRIPFGGFDPGVYEINVTATQGGATVRRSIAIEVQNESPTPASSASPGR
jgi:hypothetical protein